MVTATRTTASIPPPSPTPLSAFYSSYLSEEDRPRYEAALAVDGLQGEIALLRVQLGHVCHDDPHNAPMFLRLTNAINRLIKTQRMLKMDEADEAVGPAKSLLDSLWPTEPASELDTGPAANRRPDVGADPRVCLDPSYDSRLDRDSLANDVCPDPLPPVHSEQPGTSEPGNLSPCQGEIERGRDSDQGAADQSPLSFATLAASLMGDQNKPLFQHGNVRNKKKNKKAHSHRR